MKTFPPAKQRLATLGTLLAALLVTAAPAARAADAEERFEKSLELGGVQKVRVQNVNGPVHVETWENPTLSIVAVKKAKGSGAAEALKETEIRIRQTATAVDIETVLPKSSGWSVFSWWGRPSTEVSYELKLPAGVAVHVETVNGRVQAERRSGPLVLNTVNGSIKVSGQEGPVRANTVNGSVDISFAGTARKSDLETVNGSVTVTAARDSSIRYSLQTVNGRIRSEFAELNVEGKWGPKEARGEVNGGREALSIETVNGEVRLQVADAAVRR
ncbi:MAG TPA: DUF4097 family beta strand repeat-containing protein [Thermoanaerobaculia bacterium]|nr:DUF4097 family beta strand repeat-containing protein [Thermoanaerobaculia bacterium]HQR68465.1 DUF4097 family beta strand repeat-containing protein [Thermoanaerobaculia bacterium]